MRVERPFRFPCLDRCSNSMRSKEKTLRESMPFYLVTQTSLIEAQDENAAALKAVELIRSGRKVAVTVKADEATLTRVVVPAKTDDYVSMALRHPDIDAPREHLPSPPVEAPPSDKKGDPEADDGRYPLAHAMATLWKFMISTLLPSGFFCRRPLFSWPTV
ncbi:hypothetical protein [Rhizobium sp. 16-449-1b]|uniref:hypothetical protein n=1 Tax=Rhizobium sp. 16-449-1b TaxID=2819989 RepID=UPI001ADC110A|nr:hypothetical protein [Rhizobium sp. 16-449-1b]